MKPPSAGTNPTRKGASKGASVGLRVSPCNLFLLILVSSPSRAFVRMVRRFLPPKSEISPYPEALEIARGRIGGNSASHHGNGDV